MMYTTINAGGKRRMWASRLLELYGRAIKTDMVRRETTQKDKPRLKTFEQNIPLQRNTRRSFRTTWTAREVAIGRQMYFLITSI